jgi:hypothetical protein
VYIRIYVPEYEHIPYFRREVYVHTSFLKGSICIYTLRDESMCLSICIYFTLREYVSEYMHILYMTREYMYILFYYFDKYTYCLEKMVRAYTNFQQEYACIPSIRE